MKQRMVVICAKNNPKVSLAHVTVDRVVSEESFAAQPCWGLYLQGDRIGCVWKRDGVIFEISTTGQQTPVICDVPQEAA